MHSKDPDQPGWMARLVCALRILILLFLHVMAHIVFVRIGSIYDGYALGFRPFVFGTVAGGCSDLVYSVG